MKRKISKGFKLIDKIFTDLKGSYSPGRKRLNNELLAEVKDKKLLFEPIFVLGPPRCGSTLFYQVMTHMYEFTYFSNSMMKEPYYVASVVKSKNLDLNYKTNFNNKFGATEEGDGPHEAFPFWRRFYPREIHDYIQSEDHVSGIEKEEIVNTIKYLEYFYSRPFFSKNMEMSLRLKSLQKIFPHAIFILLERDPRAIASSIVDARNKLYNDRNKWWSMRPDSYERLLNEPYHIQAAHQVADVYKAIEQDLKSERVLNIRYEHFCDKPEEVTLKVEKFLTSNGIEIVKKDNNDIPESFHYKKDTLFNGTELDELDVIFRENNLSHLYMIKP